MKEEISLLKLFFTFSKVGVMTFGGGMAMLPILIEEIVVANKWASEEEIADYFAIGQCTPGVIAVNTATFIGKKTRGILGAICATLGLVFPSIIIITALAGIISVFADNVYVQRAFSGIRVGVCILVLNSVIKLAKTAFKGKVAVITFLICAFFAVIMDTSPVIIVLSCIVVGILGFFMGKPKEAYND